MLVVSWLCRHWPHLSLRQFWFQETCLSCCLMNDNRVRGFGSQPSPSSGDKLAENKHTLGSAYGKYVWHSSTCEIASARGTLTRPGRHLHRCGRLVGGNVYPLGVWYCNMSAFLCVYLLCADFTLLP